MSRPCALAQNGDPLIQKQLHSATRGVKLHREPLRMGYCGVYDEL